MSRVVQCIGCGRIGAWGRTGRCDDCRLARNRSIDANPQRKLIKRIRYGTAHRKDRAEWHALVNAGIVQCARCGYRIAPGAAFDLDHLDNGLSHPSHPHCNRAARANPGETTMSQPTDVRGDLPQNTEPAEDMRGDQAHVTAAEQDAVEVIGEEVEFDDQDDADAIESELFDNTSTTVDL